MEIFQSITYAKITFKNRIIRSATTENMADKNGKPTGDLLKKYEQLAKGGVGGIITGEIAVSSDGKPMHSLIPSLDCDENIEAFLPITQQIRSHKVPIIAQLVHTGGQSQRVDAIAPSKVNDYKAREMSEEEIKKVIEDFAQATLRAKKAGFNGVELHCAHGFLLSEFLSPRTNKRTDQWGGNTLNRTRIVTEIVKRARELVGDYPILAKINGYEPFKGGLNILEGIEIAKRLQECQCDGLEISNGMLKAGMAAIRGNIPVEMLLATNAKLKKLPSFLKPLISKLAKFAIPTPKPTQNYNLESAKMIKAQVKIPVIVVGGITEIDTMREIISKQWADIISLARPLIIEPNFVKKLQEGKVVKSKCIQCNYCVIGVKNEPLRCYYGKIPQKA
ncbi:NADH:flavin oxidoreductase [Helicobacter cholecystus]|uniref:NADH:flavin oxidoreductase n=1 Tax=Helicobacter cholecystus TaxID=45498 RepID=UPI002738D2E9|nr:NADH:flavin oxidoreductase [Helicobacter cholecystus]